MVIKIGKKQTEVLLRKNIFLFLMYQAQEHRIYTIHDLSSLYNSLQMMFIFLSS